MVNNKFMGLSVGEQTAAVFFGGFYAGMVAADELVNKLEQSQCQTVPPSNFAEMQCPPHLKAIELGGGSAIIITGSFAVAGLIAAAKHLNAKNRQQK